MIFNLFKSKNNWQHKDINVRIAAINEELAVDNAAQKAILLTLLNNDPSELVRRAVLLKFNNFEQYYAASMVNELQAIQDFALLQVKGILTDQHELKLSFNLKEQFLTSHKHDTSLSSSLLNYWLEHETESQMVILLFNVLITKKKNTSQFLQQVFSNKQKEEIQKQLLSLELDELNEIALLHKLEKKSVNDSVKQLINSKLTLLSEQAEKPKRVFKQSQLLLSKLLALKDTLDFESYLNKKTLLLAEWDSNSSSLDCLTEEERLTLLTKFDKIIAQLKQMFAQKAETHQQAIIAQQLLAEKAKATNDLNEAILSFNQKIINAVFESDSSDAELLTQQNLTEQLQQLNELLENSVLNQNERAAFYVQISQIEKRLTQLPEIAESVSEATYLISNISQLSLPQTLVELNDRQQTYVDWLTKWKAVDKKACGVLPESINDAHKEIKQLWQKGLTPLQQEQKALFNQTKKKLADLKRLLASGKYKVCFGLFKGVNQGIELLSVSQKHQLQRDYDNASEKMSEISDWEHYIATPRKQALLTEINELVTNPVDNPNDQADKVKQFRKIWNTLGHAEEGLDKDLNDQFNLACEQAFAPCRLFYGEQEKLRAQHLIIRQQVIDQAAKLSASVSATSIDKQAIDFKLLEGKLNKIHQRWQQAGEVARSEYQKLFKQYKNNIEPIKILIKSFHDDNTVQKQALIVKAEQQLATEDIYQAIEIIKGLQRAWREIGFAGSSQESKLWQKFRNINDQVFAKREQFKSAQQAELEQISADFDKQLLEIKTSIKDIDNSDSAPLLDAKQKAESLLELVHACKPALKPIIRSIDLFIKELKKSIDDVAVNIERKNWHSLFMLLKKIASRGNTVATENILSNQEYNELTNFWQKRIVEQLEVSTSVASDARNIKTLEIEILAKVDSPAELAQQRMAVQVSLIQEQMLSALEVDLTSALVEWLKLGQLVEHELTLLERLQLIYVK